MAIWSKEVCCSRMVLDEISGTCTGLCERGHYKSCNCTIFQNNFVNIVARLFKRVLSPIHGIFITNILTKTKHFIAMKLRTFIKKNSTTPAGEDFVVCKYV